MKMSVFSRLTIIACLLGFSTTHAAIPVKKIDEEQKNPLGCRDKGYRYELKTLTLLPESEGAQQSLYFFHNTANQAISLYQMRGDEESTRSMYLNHVIEPNQWAVLSTSESAVKYICTANAGAAGYGKILNCADSIHVCEYLNVKYGLNNRGNFWLVKGNNRGGAVNDVLRYGIIPR